LGKFNAVSKGSRKITSHFCGHLETLNICQFELYKSQYRLTITQAAVEKNFKNIRENFKISVFALLLLEIIQKTTFIEENIEGGELFLMLERALESLPTSQFPFLTVERFKLQLLQNLGALPEITTCSRCQKRWEPKTIIHLTEDNHLTCKECSGNSHVSHRTIDFNIIKLMHFLLTKDLENLKIMLSKNEKEKLQNFTNIFLYHYTDKEIFTDKIIDLVSEYSSFSPQFSI
jgi:DNA repair protein RecO